MDVMPSFLEVIDQAGRRVSRRLERVRQTSWSETDWDRIIVENTDLLASALRTAGAIAANSELRLLGTQIDNIDVVLAEVSRDPDHSEVRRLVLVEDKLLRNSEARRSVLGQIVDYSRVAQDDWPSANLAEKFGSTPADRQWVQARDEQFRQIARTGDFLLIIMGDGIDDGMARLARRFAGHDNPLTLAELALVSMPLYQLDDQYLLVPHVVSAVLGAKRELTVRVVVQDHLGRPVPADVAEALPDRAEQRGIVVRDEVVAFLRAVAERVRGILPGVAGTKVPRKSLDFLQTAPDRSSAAVKVHFGGFQKDIWSPIEVGISLIAPDVGARDQWVERFKARRGGLGDLTIRIAGPRSVELLTLFDWKTPTDLTPALEEAVANAFASHARVLKEIMEEMAGSGLGDG